PGATFFVLRRVDVRDGAGTVRAHRLGSCRGCTEPTAAVVFDFRGAAYRAGGNSDLLSCAQTARECSGQGVAGTIGSVGRAQRKGEEPSGCCYPGGEREKDSRS